MGSFCIVPSVVKVSVVMTSYSVMHSRTVLRRCKCFCFAGEYFSLPSPSIQSLYRPGMETGFIDEGGEDDKDPGEDILFLKRRLNPMTKYQA